MNPRYFIGVSLPDDITSKIQDVQGALLGKESVMEPLIPHITLLHPNILMTLSPLYFIPKVSHATQTFLPFNVELTGIAQFDTRVLYIAVKSPRLTKLQRSLVELLPDDIQARYMAGRHYTPHVTLAQAKPLQKLDPDLVALFEKELQSLLQTKFDVKSLAQFKSHGPRRYQAVPI